MAKGSRKDSNSQVVGVSNKAAVRLLVAHRQRPVVSVWECFSNSCPVPPFCPSAGQLSRAGLVRSEGGGLGQASRSLANTPLTTLQGAHHVLGCHAIFTEEEGASGSLPCPRFTLQRLTVLSRQRKQPWRKSASLQR